MEYREIVSVTGLSGLYQLLSTKSDGAIVRNVSDKTTKFISARQHNVTPLESIEVYTVADNVRLHNVFQNMQEHEAAVPVIDHKSASKAAISAYFKTVFPEFDEDRVYVSDMKKMLKWYELLKSNDLLHFEVATHTEGADEESTAENAGVEESEAKKNEEPAAEAEDAEVKAPKKTAKKKKEGE
ncbi:MAG: DUF5606 domain-containing protein [Taibaiella sp.]|nr:DUF5606 domain-containing protein [Taibaiella sp.]